ncbi:MAG: hypothetical protein LBR08_11430 [Bacteroidales bacterium]|jgi:hypothetical protein|nr:hypothetical protein [Bacteroidales bacterium]
MQYNIPNIIIDMAHIILSAIHGRLDADGAILDVACVVADMTHTVRGTVPVMYGMQRKIFFREKYGQGGDKKIGMRKRWLQNGFGNRAASRGGALFSTHPRLPVIRRKDVQQAFRFPSGK